MPSDALLWTATPPPPRKPRSGERLWTLAKSVSVAHAELKGHGEFGWEWQIFRDGSFLFGRLSPLRAQALAFAEEQRHELLKRGWTDADKTPT